MRREYNTYKCPACGYETEQSYFASSSYGNFHDTVDLQAKNAEREAEIIKNPCPVCRKGGMETKNWVQKQDPEIWKMGIEDYFSLLKKGSAAWNNWMQKHPAANPSLSGLDLRKYKHLNDCNIPYPCLSATDLRGLDLSKVLDFSQFKRLDTVSVVNLNCADLREARLKGVFMVEPVFKGCDMSGADLRHSVFRRVCLNDVNLSGADLRGAKWTVTACRGADFTGCKVHRTEIRSFGCASNDERTISNLEKAEGRYVYKGANGDVRVPEKGQFGPEEFGVYIDPPEFQEDD